MSDNPDQERVRLNSPPQVMTVQFNSAWNIVTPAPYRYEDRRWVDQFFDTGALRLSTFSQFANYEDEIRGDDSEGRGVGYGETRDDKSVMVAHAHGVSAAVFCCSHRLDHSLRTAFSRDSAFQITNTLGFSFEIARQLPGFRHGLEGSCIYRADTMIKRSIDLDIESYKLPDGNYDMRMISDASRKLAGPELLLLKRKRYEVQQEYRLLWDLDSADANYIEIVAPLARQHCRKLDESEWGD